MRSDKRIKDTKVYNYWKQAISKKIKIPHGVNNTHRLSIKPW